MRFVSNRKLETRFEYDAREGDTLDEVREVMTKRDFSQLKQYVVTTSMVFEPPAEDFKERPISAFGMSGNPKTEAGWLAAWAGKDYAQITVTIQEDDKVPVEVYNQDFSGSEATITAFYDLHHEWVKRTFDGVMR